MEKNITVRLEPYWNIEKYGIRNVNAVEKEDELADKLKQRIAERYPGIKKVKVSVYKYEPIPIDDRPRQSDDVQFRHSNFGFRVDLEFSEFMNVNDVRKNVLKIGKKLRHFKNNRTRGIFHYCKKYWGE